jgi:hypothetical protein
MITQADASELTGAELCDSNGDRVGTIGSIFSDRSGDVVRVPTPRTRS